jgi:hypothetical protein
MKLIKLRMVGGLGNQLLIPMFEKVFKEGANQNYSKQPYSMIDKGKSSAKGEE